MSVFENLIEELKRENLIEEGVYTGGDQMEQEEIHAAPVLNLMQPENSSAETISFSEAKLVKEPDLTQPLINDDQFFRRRAMEEVSSLQMVEHILSGVEREQMKILPKSYDDIAVSKALHEFLKVSKNSNSPDNASAEFKLMQETESWYSALSYRDKNIHPAHLRRYCETTKPALSAQALAALARFYRNSPYSESIRSKFDMVITRLFSQELDDDVREMAFEFSEIVQHLSELYADWSSVSLYATDNDTELITVTQKFQDFIREAKVAQSFEELVKNDFFNRLRAFKESTGENFYAPIIAARVIECNIQVGNIYIDLLNKERRANGLTNLENKYSHLLDQTISEATSKTIQLADLIQSKNSSQAEEEDVKTAKVENLFEAVSEGKKVAPGKKRALNVGKYLQINKWLLLASILTIVLTFGLYSWTKITEPEPNRAGVESFELNSYYFKDYLVVAKITHENLIGIVNSSWSQISDEKKQEVLKNMMTVGKDKGFKTVRLQNNEGKTVGYASGDTVNISNSN